MITITPRSRQALEILIELGLADGDVVPVAELIRRRGFRESTMTPVMALLRDGGLIISRRGVNGGFQRIRPADTITVADVVELIDGPVGADLDPGVFTDAAHAIRDTLVEHTLSDCIQQEQRPADGPAPMYWI